MGGLVRAQSTRLSRSVRDGEVCGLRVERGSAGGFATTPARRKTNGDHSAAGCSWRFLARGEGQGLRKADFRETFTFQNKQLRTHEPERAT
jgi:hypothetical protein